VIEALILRWGSWAWQTVWALLFFSLSLGKPSSSAVVSFMPGNVPALTFGGKYCLKQLRGLQITNIFPWRIKK